ncbi:hypothetical protein OK348_06050 [Flavobacterium sp. MXW15]|uniref:Uncharacterized protein n=1 Tax=Xanthomonas chitinilytica TaxID=2989819 RepID=A0ABT3JSV4_9XANT|nr:hypothetical protein [Xanthomonas sp. H13-6]MCW4454353.1 hypothetical protein [Flavobacterium sp. MXW15]MCW4471586.1 hypothetical protein [Xanthomonas sp. H13-6]
MAHRRMVVASRRIGSSGVRHRGVVVRFLCRRAGRKRGGSRGCVVAMVRLPVSGGSRRSGRGVMGMAMPMLRLRGAGGGKQGDRQQRGLHAHASTRTSRIMPASMW